MNLDLPQEFAFIGVEHGDKDIKYIRRRLDELKEDPKLKPEIVWEGSVFDQYLFILKMNSQLPMILAERGLYLCRKLNFVGKSYDYLPTDREITDEGLRVLEKDDTPLPISIYLDLVKEGWPTGVIRKTAQLTNLEYLDVLCSKKGYTVEI